MEPPTIRKVDNEREKARASECPMRGRGTCEDIAGNLGWNHGVDLDICDMCWAKGGVDGGASFRDEIMTATLATFSDPERLLKAPENIILAMLRWHLTPEAVKILQAHPDFEFSLKRSELWNQVKGTWIQAGSFLKSMTSRGLTSRRVDITIKGQRHESCFGTDPSGRVTGTACRSLSKSPIDGGAFCGACGCGDTGVARLDGEPYSKLDYPYLECPRQRPGFSNGK